MKVSAAIAAGAVVVLATTIADGVGRAEHYALKHDPHGAGAVAVWALLLAPLVGGLGGAFVVAPRRPRVARTVGASLLGAAAGVVVGGVTLYLVQLNVSCVNKFGSDECGLGSYAVFLGAGLLVILLVVIGIPLVALGRRSREGLVDART